MQVIGSLLYFLVMVLSTIVVIPLFMLTAPFVGFDRRSRLAGVYARINIFACRWLCRIKYEVEYEHPLTDAKSAIVFCKHQSTWETFALQMFIPPHVWILKQELMKVPFFGWGMSLLEPIPIDRSAGRKAVKQVIEQGTDRLDRGRWVVIFPEGTRVAPGERKRYGQGGALLAAKSGYPVQPVAHNAGEFWPRHGLIKKPGTVKMVFGPLIETKGKSASDINTEAEAWIESTVARISERELLPSPADSDESRK